MRLLNHVACLSSNGEQELAHFLADSMHLSGSSAAVLFVPRSSASRIVDVAVSKISSLIFRSPRSKECVLKHNFQVGKFYD